MNQHVQDVVGGSEIQSDLIARQLHELKHTVLYGVANGRHSTYHVPYQTAVLDSPFANSYWRLAKAFQPDVVYWRFNKWHLLSATMIAAVLRIKFVFAMCAYSDTQRWVWTGRTILPRESGNGALFGRILRTLSHLQWPLRSRINFTGYRWVDGIVTNNAQFLNIVPVMPQIAIHNSAPTDCEQFTWARPYVVWISSIKPKKNPEAYIALATALNGLDVDFLMVGAIQDTHYDFIRDASQMPENVHYLGQRSPQSVNGILRGALFLIHTCDPEGFSGNFIQAWMQGKPTVSLYHDPESVIETNDIGYLSRTQPQFEQDVIRLIEDDTLREDMGRRALQFARQNFDPATNVKKLDQFLHEIVAK